MAYQYDPPPGPPLNPADYNGVVGPNGQRYGQQEGFQYNPVTDKYDPKPDKPKQPGIGSVLGPVAAGAGAIAAGTYLGNPSNYGGVASGIKDIFGLGASAPAVATGATAPVSSIAAATPAAVNAGAAGAAPAVPNIVSATATPTAAGAPFSLGGAALQGAGIAAGGYTGYQQFKGAENVLKGKDLDFQQQAALALPTFGLSFLANPIKDFFGTGKDKAQQRRDALREQWKEMGLIDEQYNIYNADGTPFNVGLDGGAMLEGGAYDGKRHYYDVNLDDPNQVALIPIADVLAALTGAAGDKKLTSDAAGYFVNAAMASGDPQQNMLSYFQKLGLDHDKAYGMIHMMAQPGPNGEKPILSNELADSYKNTLDRFNSRGAYANGATPPPVAQAPVAAPAPASGSNLGTKPAVISPQSPKPAPVMDEKPQAEKPKVRSAIPTRAQGTRAR